MQHVIDIKKIEEKGVVKKGSEKPPEQVAMTVEARINSLVSNLTTSDTSADNSRTYSSMSNIAGRSLGGRPIEFTKERKRSEAEEVMKTKNEIAQRIMEAREIVKHNIKRVKNRFMSEVIDQVKKKQKIEHHNIPLKTIKQRLYRKKIEINHCPCLAPPPLHRRYCCQDHHETS